MTQKHYCYGMKFYGDKIPLKYYNNKEEPTFFLGLYFKGDYDIYKQHRGNKVVFWNGSDVLRLMDNKDWIKTIKKYPAKHYCHNQLLQDELKEMYIDAEIVPLFFGYKKDYEVSYKHSLPIKLFSCAHDGREIEYGVNIIKELARDEDLKDVEFHIYGISGESTSNLIYHGRVQEEQMNNEIKQYHGCLRLNIHDGLSQIIIKSMLLGLYVIKTRDKEVLKKEIIELGEKREPAQHDTTGIQDLNWFEKIK